MSAQENEDAYWIVSVPNWASAGKAKANAKKTKKQEEEQARLTKRALEQKVAKLCESSEFRVPMLRVGTLDKLMMLSDSLAKTDLQVEGVVKKIEKTYGDLLAAEGVHDDDIDNSEHKRQLLVADEKTPARYAESFAWNAAKYPEKAALHELVDRIRDDVMNTDEEMKKKANRFSEVSATLGAMERKETGTLLVRPLGPLVREEVLIEREFITTLLVVVPRAKTKEWEDSYELMEGAEQDVKNVVPRSSLKLHEDDDFALYRVLVFRRGVDAVRSICRENRWTVRTYSHDPEREVADGARKVELAAKRGKLLASFILWCETTYSEVFAAWMHIKAVRVFVESVLRFGIPVQFQAYVLKPKKGYRTKLRAALDELYGWLGSGSGAGAAAAAAEKEEEFYAYVYLTLDI